MSTSSSGRLLISHITLRGPELRQTYTLIAQKLAVTYTRLVEQTVASTEGNIFRLEEAPLREALSFLSNAGMVEQSGTGPNRRLRATPRLHETSFALLLLHHLAAHHDIRQRALLLIYQLLTTEQVRSIDLREARRQMEGSSYGRLFAWTGEKLTFWSHLLEYVGLLRRLRTGMVVCLPQQALVLSTLRTVVAASGVYNLTEILERIEQQFFACFTARGQIHGGLAQTLIALHRTGQIRLRHSADAARSLMLGDWRVSEVILDTPVEVSS